MCTWETAHVCMIKRHWKYYVWPSIYGLCSLTHNVRAFMSHNQNVCFQWPLWNPQYCVSSHQNRNTLTALKRAWNVLCYLPNKKIGSAHTHRHTHNMHKSLPKWPLWLMVASYCSSPNQSLLSRVTFQTTAMLLHSSTSDVMELFDWPRNAVVLGRGGTRVQLLIWGHLDQPWQDPVEEMMSHRSKLTNRDAAEATKKQQFTYRRAC